MAAILNGTAGFLYIFWLYNVTLSYLVVIIIDIIINSNHKNI